jgi:hypothetical protein
MHGRTKTDCYLPRRDQGPDRNSPPVRERLRLAPGDRIGCVISDRLVTIEAMDELEENPFVAFTE